MTFDMMKCDIDRKFDIDVVWEDGGTISSLRNHYQAIGLRVNVIVPLAKPKVLWIALHHFLIYFDPGLHILGQENLLFCVVSHCTL